MYHGTAFHMNAKFNLIRRFDSWSFDKDTPYEIVDSITTATLIASMSWSTSTSSTWPRKPLRLNGYDIAVERYNGCCY